MSDLKTEEKKITVNKKNCYLELNKARNISRFWWPHIFFGWRNKQHRIRWFLLESRTWRPSGECSQSTVAWEWTLWSPTVKTQKMFDKNVHVNSVLNVNVGTCKWKEIHFILDIKCFFIYPNPTFQTIKMLSVLHMYYMNFIQALYKVIACLPSGVCNANQIIWITEISKCLMESTWDEL